MGDQLRQVWDHALHAAWRQTDRDSVFFKPCYSILCGGLYSLGFAPHFISSPLLTFSYRPQHKDAGLFNYPLWMEQQLFEQRQDVQQQVVPEHVGQHVQRCR